MLANPARVFERTRIPVRVLAKPYERRVVCVLPSAQATVDRRTVVSSCSGACGHTKFTRTKVNAAVERGEMRFLDRHGNMAAFTVVAAGTWQKTRSGPVCTMQMIVGQKGRHVPAQQRDNFEVPA